MSIKNIFAAITVAGLLFMGGLVTARTAYLRVLGGGTVGLLFSHDEPIIVDNPSGGGLLTSQQSPTPAPPPPPYPGLVLNIDPKGRTSLHSFDANHGDIHDEQAPQWERGEARKITGIEVFALDTNGAPVNNVYPLKIPANEPFLFETEIALFYLNQNGHSGKIFVRQTRPLIGDSSPIAVVMDNRSHIMGRKFIGCESKGNEQDCHHPRKLFLATKNGTGPVQDGDAVKGVVVYALTVSYRGVASASYCTGQYDPKKPQTPGNVENCVQSAPALANVCIELEPETGSNPTGCNKPK